MQHNEQPMASSFQAGIISFKNLRGGFLKFGIKSPPKKGVDNEITTTVFDEYIVQLTKLITEIVTVEIPFTEKEV